MNTAQLEKIRSGRGFFAALDQSGGSTPKALAEYGVSEDRYSSEAEMFDLVHAMRTRVMTSPSFSGDRVLGAILFEQTMDREVEDVPTAQYLWERKQVVPFLKVDLGLADEDRAVQLMKPIDTLDELLARATRHGIFGTKMRSVIHDADEGGIEAVADQQFEYGARIAAAGLVPILEPEVSIKSPHKAEGEELLRDALHARLKSLSPDPVVMFKLTIPTERDLYAELAADPHVLRVLALSGGYDRDEACRLLVENPSMIASFSRALLQGLTDQQSDDEFNTTLEDAITEISAASAHDRRRPHRFG